MNSRNKGHWLGVIPPQYIFSNRKFMGIAVNPPDFEPGSWCGAGKALYDSDLDLYILTSRPRMSKDDKRGFAASIYTSEDGVNNFNLEGSITKEEIMDLTGLSIASIEGTQLIRDPSTNNWYFYPSIDIGEEFVWGGKIWNTLLLTSTDLKGPWESKGIVLKNDQRYDEYQARDCSIDIIDGVYFNIYKAMDKNRNRRPGFATSLDGIDWKKHGVLTTDGKDECNFLSGSFFEGVNGPMFLGTQMLSNIDPNVEHEMVDKHNVKHGQSMVQFCAYTVDYRNLNLETIFRARWEPTSKYEHPVHPLLGYSSSLLDPKENRVLMYLEVIDPMTKKMGLNNTVERVLVFESRF
ncbi:MAG: hypothetical protein ACFFCS_00230 [Candidatus Hodarchaeota archaeon]